MMKTFKELVQDNASCEKCGVAVGEPCHHPNGLKTWPHKARIKAYRRRLLDENGLVRRRPATWENP